MTADEADEDDSLLRYLDSVSHQVLALLDLDGRLARSPRASGHHHHHHNNNKQQSRGSKHTEGKKSSAKSSHRRQQPGKSAPTRGRFWPLPVSNGDGQTKKAPSKRPPRIRAPRVSSRRDRGKGAQQDKARGQRVAETNDNYEHLRAQQALLQSAGQLPPSSQQHHLSTTTSCNNINGQQQQQQQQQLSHQHQQPLYMGGEHQSSHIIVACVEPLQLSDGPLTLSSLGDELGNQLVVASHELSPLADSDHHQQQHNHVANPAYYSPASVYDDLVLAPPTHAQSQFTSQPSRPSPHESDNYGHHHMSPRPASNIHLQQHQPPPPPLVMHPIMDNVAPLECYQEQQPPAYSHLHHHHHQQRQSGAINEHSDGHQHWLSPLLGGHEPTVRINSHERTQQQQQQTAGYQPTQVYQQQPSYYNNHEHNPFHPARGAGHHHNHHLHNHELIAANGDQNVAGASKAASTSPTLNGEHSYHNHHHHHHHDLDEQQQQHLIEPGQQNNHHDQDHHHHHHQLQQHLHSAHFHHGSHHGHNHHHHHLMAPGIGLVNGIEPSSVILQDINLASASWSSPEDLYSI